MGLLPLVNPKATTEDRAGVSRAAPVNGLYL